MFCEHYILVSSRYLQHVSVIQHPDVLTLLFYTSERRALTRFSVAHSFDKLLSWRRIMMGPLARPRATADTLADNLANNQASDVATNMAAAAQPYLSYTSMCWASYRDLAKLKLFSAPCNCWWWGCLQIWWTNLQIHDNVRLSWQVTIEPSDCSWALKLSLQFSQELTICQRADTLQPSWQSAICWAGTMRLSCRADIVQLIDDSGADMTTVLKTRNVQNKSPGKASRPGGRLNKTKFLQLFNEMLVFSWFCKRSCQNAFSHSHYCKTITSVKDLEAAGWAAYASSTDDVV